MSRLRITLSELPEDREVASKVASAQRLLQDALRVCDYRRESDPVKRRRMMAVRRDLERALGALSNVRRVGIPGSGLDEEQDNTPDQKRQKDIPSVADATGTTGNG